MSNSQTKSKSEQNRELREPRSLSNEYHKARKQLMLWAGILFIWELVGIDLDKLKESEGNLGAVLKGIKSPQAVPWVLLILVAYFLFKIIVEWFQCAAARRRMRVARVDLLSAIFVSMLAYGLYVWQTISRVQVADRIGFLDGTQAVAAGGSVSVTAGLLWTIISRDRTGVIIFSISLGVLIILGFVIPNRLGATAPWAVLLGSILIGALFVVIAKFIQFVFTRLNLKRFFGVSSQRGGS